MVDAIPVAPIDEQLKASVNNVLVAAGHLLLYLNADTSAKVIPNSRGGLQTTIDTQIRSCHRVLDELDMEIQFARKAALTKKQEQAEARERHLAEAAKLSEQSSQPELGIGNNPNSDAAVGGDDDNDELIELGINLDGAGGADGLDLDGFSVTKDGNDDSNENGADKPTQDGNNDNDNQDGTLSGYNFDLPQGSLDTFDDDLNVLLGTVGDPNSGNGQGPDDDMNKNGANDDGMDGLFGDDFDFIIPNQ